MTQFTLSRRAALAGIAVAAPAGALAAAAPDPDARLIELGRQCDALYVQMAAANEASQPLAAIDRALDPLIQEILETPVHTIAGLGVKARAAQNACAGYWYDEASNLDWDARAARSLIEAALAVAGRDFVYLEPERNEAPENKISDDPNSPESVASRTKIRAERIRELPGELVHMIPPDRQGAYEVIDALKALVDSRSAAA